MPDSQFYTNDAAFAKAKAIQTTLATSKVRFFQGSTFVPTTSTDRATLIANECTFSGYTSGGYSLTAWTGPGNSPAGGSVLTSPLINPTLDGTASPIVSNVVSGWWVEDDSTPTPQVRLVGIFNPVRSMAISGDTFPWLVQITEGRNPPPSAPV